MHFSCAPEVVDMWTSKLAASISRNMRRRWER